MTPNIYDYNNLLQKTLENVEILKNVQNIDIIFCDFLELYFS